MKKFRRLLLFPFGITKKIFELANEGARDIDNKLRFKNSIIDRGCCIDSKSILGSNVHLLENCTINNSSINSFTYLGKNCLVQNSTIGKFCSIANNVSIGLGQHPLDLFSTSPLFYRKKNTFLLDLIERDLFFDEYRDIKIGNDVWIGANAILLDGITIGDGVVIGANSVVTKDLPPYAIVGGIPAKIIRYRFTDEDKNNLMIQKWWEWDVKIIKSYFNL